VGHVGDELGFVAGGDGELADFFLDEVFGSFDFEIFLLGFDVLGGQEFWLGGRGLRLIRGVLLVVIGALGPTIGIGLTGSQ